MVTTQRTTFKLLLIFSVSYLLRGFLPGTALPRHSVEEVIYQKNDLQGETIQLEGWIIRASITKTKDAEGYLFDVKRKPPKEGSAPSPYQEKVPEEATLLVHHTGPVPDSFSCGGESLITGFLDEEGIFQSEQVLTKNPSKYDATHCQ